MSRIFISYRREDARGHAGRLYDRLTAHFGQDQVFMDIDTIEPGEDFVTAIAAGVGSVDALIAVIGRSWLDVLDPDTGRRRLENVNDFVRLEIKTALERKIRVIPVLVQQASMPLETELPADVAGLARRNALQLTDLHWKAGVDRLIETVAKILDERGVAKAEPHAPQAESGRITQPGIRSNASAEPERKPGESDRREMVRPRGPERVKTAMLHGAEAREICRLEHDISVECVALSRDGRSVATASPKEAIVWSAETGGTIHEGIATSIGGIALSADGELLATFTFLGREAHLWRIADAREVTRLPHEDCVSALCFDPIGRYLATASRDGSGRIWDLQGRQLASLAHGGGVTALAVSADGIRLATASEDKTARVWELR